MSGRHKLNLARRESLAFGRVLLDEVSPILRHIGVHEDRIDGALRFAESAVDALVRIDKHLVVGFVDAIDRTNGHTGLVFYADAGFGYNVGHF